jgi:hypothetical protein
MILPEAQEDPLAHLFQDEAILFCRFLILIRENYAKADKAALFLERKAGITNTCGIANLRDVLSHMATLLDQTTLAERRAAQLASAEEHLRRAIIEPYELAIAALAEKFTKIYDGYREKVIPIAGSTEGFSSYPNRISIEHRLAEIDKLAEHGKHAKARNRWDGEWENGVASLIDGYNKLSELHGELEEAVFRLNQIRTAAHHTKLHRMGIVWAIVGTILGVAGLIGGYLFTRYATSLAAPAALTPPISPNSPAAISH